MDRILLLIAAASYAAAEPALVSAMDSAFSARRISVGLVLREEPDGEARARMAQLPAPRYIVGTDSPWQVVQEEWQGETWVFLGSPDMRFNRDWDRRLERDARACQRRSGIGAVLSGCLPRTTDALEAVSPVAAAGFDSAGRLIQGRGQPLRYASDPEPAALIHPDCCFAPAAFFRDVAETGCDPFWAAFKRRWAVYTIAAPVAVLEREDSLPLCEAPADPEGRARFAHHFGIDFDRRELSAKAREGIWRAGLEAPARIPLRVKLQEQLRGLDGIASRLTPLAVTAWLETGDERTADADFDQALARFRRLAAMQNVPLQCFADVRRARAVTQAHPNTLNYKSRYGMPGIARSGGPAGPEELALSKPFLLAAAREKDMNHSHFVWMDFDYLRYPIYERAAVDWPLLCGEKICLAAVDGVPDSSMVCVPAELVLPLCQSFQAIFEALRRRGGGIPADTEVWRKLISARPDRFEVIALPEPRELFSLIAEG